MAPSHMPDACFSTFSVGSYMRPPGLIFLSFFSCFRRVKRGVPHVRHAHLQASLAARVVNLQKKSAELRESLPVPLQRHLADRLEASCLAPFQEQARDYHNEAPGTSEFCFYLSLEIYFLSSDTFSQHWTTGSAATCMLWESTQWLFR